MKLGLRRSSSLNYIGSSAFYGMVCYVFMSGAESGETIDKTSVLGTSFDICMQTWLSSSKPNSHWLPSLEQQIYSETISFLV